MSNTNKTPAILASKEASRAFDAAVAALTPITTADATDPATTMALANECKAKVNAIIAALKGE